MTRSSWAWLRLLGAAATLAVLVWRLGAGPFLDGVRTVDARALVAALVIGVVATVLCAWRWQLVARGLGVDLRLPAAVAAYYRSQLLNTVVPGGFVGDVHRGVRHGRDVSSVGHGLRAVAWERSAGQVVQAAVTIAVLLVLPSPVQGAMPVVATVVVGLVLLAVLLGRALPRDSASRPARAVRAVAADIQGGLLARHAWPGIVLASVVVVAGHTTTFLIAARTAGSSASLGRLLPLSLLILLAMSLPSIAGWGPREGAAAWVFGAAGLGAAQGVSTAVVYGVMVLVACLPGVGVLVVDWLRRPRPRPDEPLAAEPVRVPVSAGADGASRG